MLKDLDLELNEKEINSRWNATMVIFIKQNYKYINIIDINDKRFLSK